MTTRPLAPALLLACVLAACREPTQVTVEVRTDLPCTAISDTTITVGTAAEVDAKPATSTSVKTSCVDGRIGALVIAPSGDDEVEIGIRVVTAIGDVPVETCVAPDYRGCIVARRALRYVPHTKLKVNVTMRANCKDVPCDAAGFTTCAAGRCVSARIDSTTCEGQGCDEPAAPSDACVTSPAPAGVTSSGWTSIAPTTTIGEKGRALHEAVWTCTDMLVWGGRDTPNTDNPDLLAFTPATNSWRRLAAAPFASRTEHMALWTGSRMIVWGGRTFDGTQFKDGAIYDPATNTWTAIPPDPLTGARFLHSAVWSTTTNEMLVFGGLGVNDGVAFDPATNRYRAIARPPDSFVPRLLPSMVFVNDRMIVFAGTGFDGKELGDAASYDPKADTWTLLPNAGIAGRDNVPGVLAQIGGHEGALFFGSRPADGAFFDGTTWTVIPRPPATAYPSPARINTTMWFGGGRLFTWGGDDETAGTQATGAVFDTVAKRWDALPASPLAARVNATVVWTGRYAIVFGGNASANPNGAYPDGAFFVP